MKRVVKPGGYVVLIENLPIAQNQAQENHLQLRRIGAQVVENELGYLNKQELLDLVNKTGFKDMKVKIVDYNLCSTPAIFYISEEHIQKGIDPGLVVEYKKITQAIKKNGEVSPPTIIVKAKK